MSLTRGRDKHAVAVHRAARDHCRERNAALIRAPDDCRRRSAVAAACSADVK